MQTAYAGGTPPDVRRQDDDGIPFFVDDAKSEAHFEDVVGLNCRALLPQGVENLVVGGRCISCDHLSKASIRGAANCKATGHAAGTAVAVAALNGQFMRNVDIREPWLGESVTVRQSTMESLAAV